MPFRLPLTVFWSIQVGFNPSTLSSALDTKFLRWTTNFPLCATSFLTMYSKGTLFHWWVAKLSPKLIKSSILLISVYRINISSIFTQMVSKWLGWLWRNLIGNTMNNPVSCTQYLLSYRLHYLNIRGQVSEVESIVNKLTTSEQRSIIYACYRRC